MNKIKEKHKKNRKNKAYKMEKPDKRSSSIKAYVENGYFRVFFGFSGVRRARSVLLLVFSLEVLRAIKNLALVPDVLRPLQISIISALRIKFFSKFCIWKQVGFGRKWWFFESFRNPTAKL